MAGGGGAADVSEAYRIRAADDSFTQRDGSSRGVHAPNAWGNIPASDRMQTQSAITGSYQTGNSHRTSSSC